MAATGPNPGSTPTKVPINTPIKQNKTLTGSNATWKPILMLWPNSNVPPQMPHILLGSGTFNNSSNNPHDPSVQRMLQNTTRPQLIGFTHRNKNPKNNIVHRTKPM